MASDDEASLQFYHGALMDEDVEKLLKEDGDYLLQLRYEKGTNKPQLCLVVKSKDNIVRINVRRSEKTGGVKVHGMKKFPSIRHLMEHWVQRGVDVDGQSATLKKPIARGKFQLHHTDIKLVKKLGAGAYGTVYRGYLLNREKKVIVAVKRIDSETTDEQGLIDMMKEARVMQLYDHPNIVRFHGFIADRAPWLLVMEYCNGGSVEDKLRDTGEELSVPRRVDMCYQASTGLEYLHSKNCIHRDIATRNCLLHQQTVKLADFGMCRATAIYKVDLSKPLNVRWLAPEVWKTGETKPCTDVYAFGVMIWEMFEVPYGTPYSAWKAALVKQKVMGGYRLKPQPLMPPEMVEIMSVAWHHKPDKRPTAGELRKLLKEVCKAYHPQTIEAEEEAEKRDSSDENNTVSTTKSETMASRIRPVSKRR